MPEQNQLSIIALLLTEKHLCQLEQRTGLLEGKCCDKSIFINSGFDYYFIIISFKFLHEEKKSKKTLQVRSQTFDPYASSYNIDRRDKTRF